MVESSYDVVIVGAGPAGLSAARSSPSWQRPKGAMAAEAINRSLLREDLGVPDLG
jgi:hypothetical protein